MRWDRNYIIIAVLLVFNVAGLLLGIRSLIWPPALGPMVLNQQDVRPMMDTATSKPVYLVENPPARPAPLADYSPLILPSLINIGLLVLLIWLYARTQAAGAATG